MSVVFDRPVRDIDVRSGSQMNCAGFARILADVEPAERFEFVDAHDENRTGCDDDGLVTACVAAVRRGVITELSRPGTDRLPPVRFVLRHILVHLVDSNETRNEAAGRLAVAEAVRRLGERL
jgi:hypothetical protein